MRTENSDTIAFGCLSCIVPIFMVFLSIAYAAGMVGAIIWVLQHMGVI